MTCDQIPLLELIRGELDRESAAAIVTHLEHCQTCRERAAVMTVLETRPEILGRKRIRTTYLAAAALLVAVLGGAIGLWFLGTAGAAQDPSRLATGSRYPYVPLATRGESTPTESTPKERAFERYQAGDFAEAARLLRELPLSGDTEFYLGVSLYLAGDPVRARQHLEASRKLSARWREPALWYLANSDLKMGRIEAAGAELEELKGLGGEYSGESAELLTRLASVER